ncbi:AraC family transcriptional regulator [Paracoccus binzhouensis]|uniref:AraC family transcriptional regulator n=1 Tax=Paracoccus binzhouensis TaxID=2796149 RepID=UPI001E49341E|nr:helix-turn-helix transcriptional regulator [Paracoccus binzhouensis]
MAMSLEPALKNFDETRIRGPVVGMRVDIAAHRSEVPVHRHRQGQLVLALRGGVTCEVPKALWMVPPRCAVWIPGQMPHSVRATANARICYLFVQPEAARLPERCCTLSITPLLRELVLHMADQPSEYPPDSPAARKAAVLLEELAEMPVAQMCLPTSDEPRLRKIAALLSDDPADRRTLADWARLVAMSERSLARLVLRETGLTFGRWRQQLHLIVAMRALSSGQTVQHVAEQLGYDSVTAFITMFKKAFGKPPARYFAELMQAAEP